jgi:hypothetical protein
VLASRGSWIAKQVERFGAGEVVTVDGVDEVIEALERIVRSYPTYADAARTAGEVLAREHDPARLVQAIVADRPTGS